MPGEIGDIGESIGDTATGAAGAVERKRSTASDGHTREGACLNCGAVLAGAYCHRCGQRAHVHRTLRAFFHDLLHGVLHFEGKTWRTLPLLVLKPGKLTREYIDGRRARYVSPLALFLFSIFLMFALLQAAGLTAPANLPSPTADIRDRAVETRAALEKQRDALGPQDTAERGDLEERIDGLERTIEAIESGGNYDFTDVDGNRPYENITLTGIELIDEGIVQKWRQNPGLMFYKLQTNFYKFSWLLIPLSVPFVWLLFAWKRRFGAYDHAIFVTYSLAFMSLLFIALSLLGLAGVSPSFLFLAGSIIPPVHIYKQLRGTYELRRRSALWRLAVLLVFINVVIVLFLQTLLVMGAF